MKKFLDSNLIPLLDKKYGSLWWPDDMYPEDISTDPFKHLIITILSQNTSEVNCIRAYKGLAAKFEIKSEILANAKQEEISECIKCGGLQNVKSKRIITVTKTVLEKYNGDIGRILLLSKEEAKKRLMELPGVGNKTADVLLTDRYSYQEIIPIDTHMSRISRRLGLVNQSATYEDIQKALSIFLPKKKRYRIAGLFWLLAKHTCRAQNPKCNECLLQYQCEYKVQ